MLLLRVRFFDGVEHFELHAGFVRRSFDQGFDVFGKAGAAITCTGIQEVVADTGIAADAFANLLDVCPHELGQIGQFVHEADAGGQHGVGRVFGEFGAANVHHKQAVMVALEGRIQGAHIQLGLLVVAADHDATRAHEVLNRRAFFQELGVGHHAEWRAHRPFGQLFFNDAAHHIGGANRHGAFIDDDFVVIHVAPDVAGCGCDVLGIRAAVFAGWRTHGNKLNGAEMRSGFKIGREMQPSGFHVARHHVVQTRLVNRQAPLAQARNLVRVHIQTQHIVANLGQAGASDQANVSGSDNSDFHSARA